ncbi:MAG: hypothetical protein EHM84_09460 [Lysobacterales bacterium]|nr:MAG: hypothetical protein EHM84_09460 [Xanthomonadales bacterium]
MRKAAVDSRAIQEKLGATVFIGVSQAGTLHYVVTFPDWGAWAAFTTKMGTSKEWTAFMQKFDVANPSSTQTAVLYVDTPVVAKTLPVTVVYSWDIDYKVPGAFDTFMASAQQSVVIHSKLGASPGINIDQLGNVHYELAFDSWASWAKFSAALEKDADWAALIKKANQAPTAEMVNVYMVDTFTGP